MKLKDTVQDQTLEGKTGFVVLLNNNKGETMLEIIIVLSSLYILKLLGVFIITI